MHVGIICPDILIPHMFRQMNTYNMHSLFAKIVHISFWKSNDVHFDQVCRNT
jgi:hypothetical protein